MLTLTTPLHDKRERTSCDCSKCVAACKAMPAYLVPGDIERIADYCGADPDDEQFWAKCFLASEGPLVSRNGELYRIPTIVPAQYDDSGRCVFLSSSDKCSIHRVSPYGCSRFNVCDPPSEDADRRSTAGLAAILGSWDYMLVWQWLWTNGHRAMPLADRRRQMLIEIQKAETAEREAAMASLVCGTADIEP